MWLVFGTVIVVVLGLDLFVLHKDPHAVKIREALIWSGVWVALSLSFGGTLALLGGHGFGPETSLRFLTGYTIELALSVDNLFVFALVFAALKIPRQYQHKLLFWGVFGALVMRAAFVFAGVALVERFQWLLVALGAVLIASAIRLLVSGEKEIHAEKTLTFRVFSRLFPLKADNVGPHFWVRHEGKRYATMMFVGLILVEVTDLVFAIDSVPAVMAVAMVTDPATGRKAADPFIVYTSNAFAILGLRSLYFALAGIMAMFRFLKYGLCMILIFVGVKMIMIYWDIHVPILASLGAIGGVLGVCVALSLLIPRKVAVVAEIEVKPDGQAGVSTAGLDSDGPRAAAGP
ncbi:MAG: TerC family protein [Planctomycetes bacterium]|nr:TerC family protein [Planctomycetota bacterium]MCW8136339.1 TerC family protein [Planctomycetota bacterium]